MSDDFDVDEVAKHSYINQAMNELLFTLASKNADYAGLVDEFFNFDFASEAARVSVDDVFRVMLGVKEGRIRAIIARGAFGKPGHPNNESLLDSYKDFAGYAVLRYAYHLSNGGQ